MGDGESKRLIALDNKIMKKSYIISGVAALIIFAAVASAVSIASAAGNANGNFGGFWKNKGQNSNLTAEERTAKQAEAQTKIDAVRAALSAGDYNAWVKAVGENAPILKQINAANFNRFAEAHKLQQQADAIRQELGVNKGAGCLGEGGGMHGFGRLRQ